jgi:hypothetical protein
MSRCAVAWPVFFADHWPWELDWSVGVFFFFAQSLDTPQYLVPDQIPAECELRDVIDTFAL